VTVVRLGTDDEAQAVLSIYTEAVAARRGSPVGSDELSSTATRLRDGGGWLLGAEDLPALVGMAVGFDARADEGAGAVVPGRCHLSYVFVRPARWGEGIGGLLVDAVLAEARRRGYDQIQLWTQEDNLRARRLYSGRGFVRTERTKRDDYGDEIALWTRAL
jgi:GNAT superfamily N-acetyltransferase